MSGSGTNAGIEYQGNGYAFAASHMATNSALGWFDDFDDTPLALSTETGGAGDDLKLECAAGVIVEVLDGLDVFSFEELLGLCEDDDSDISKVAFETISRKAAIDQDLLTDLLAKIKNGGLPAAPWVSGSLLNLLLALPDEALRPVKASLLDITNSAIPEFRSRLVANLTRSWIPREEALKEAMKALNDDSPGVRNQATKTFRLLSVQGSAPG